MEKNYISTIAVTGLVLILLVFAAGFIYVVKDSDSERTFNVDGTGKVSADPDLAVIVFAVQTNGSAASGVQAENSRINADVINALTDSGLEPSDIETVSYSLYPKYVWEEKGEKQVFAGYELVHVMKIETDDTANVGKYLDSAIGAGANRVDSVSFELSKPRLKEMQKEARSKAIANAKEKAETMSQELGVELGDLVDIYTYDDSYPRPYAANVKYDSGFAGSDIMSGSVDVSVEVSLTYEME